MILNLTQDCLTMYVCISFKVQQIMQIMHAIMQDHLREFNTV